MSRHALAFAAAATLVALAAARPLAAAPADAPVDPDVDAALADAVRLAPACTAKHCLAVHLHVATTDHAAVAGADWLDRQLAEADRLLAVIDVGFRVVAIDRRSTMRVTTPADRDAIVGAGLHAGAIDVYVVFRLDDIDDPDPGWIRGVTWRRHADPDARKYIILSIAAGERVLAHELGHFFGLPHSRYPISIMNKTPRDQPPWADRRFADEEIPIMVRELARLLGAGVVTEAADPAAGSGP